MSVALIVLVGSLLTMLYVFVLLDNFQVPVSLALYVLLRSRRYRKLQRERFSKNLEFVVYRSLNYFVGLPWVFFLPASFIL